LPMMSVGATGVISVLSNIMPARVKALGRAFLDEKDPEKARSLHLELMPLFHAMFIETNPVPVKEALFSVGMMEKEVRLPLCNLAPRAATFSRGCSEISGCFKGNRGFFRLTKTEGIA